MRGIVVVVAGVLIGTADGRGQALPPVPGEMAAAEWLVGEWEGSGWIEQGGRRAEFRSREVVESRMGGRLLVVEGHHTARIPGMGEVPVHEALGVLSWDGREGRWVFRTYTARGGTGEANAAEVSDGRMVWGYDDPRMGRIRYTVTRTAEGQWRETGHASRDGGETWHPFFEMVLTRR